MVARFRITRRRQLPGHPTGCETVGLSHDQLKQLISGRRPFLMLVRLLVRTPFGPQKLINKNQSAEAAFPGVSLDRAGA
jgi:hypothetical protein